MSKNRNRKAEGKKRNKSCWVPWKENPFCPGVPSFSATFFHHLFHPPCLFHLFQSLFHFFHFSRPSLAHLLFWALVSRLHQTVPTDHGSGVLWIQFANILAKAFIAASDRCKSGKSNNQIGSRNDGRKAAKTAWTNFERMQDNARFALGHRIGGRPSARETFTFWPSIFSPSMYLTASCQVHAPPGQSNWTRWDPGRISADSLSLKAPPHLACLWRICRPLLRKTAGAGIASAQDVYTKLTRSKSLAL